jgi:hypothetical protein
MPFHNQCSITGTFKSTNTSEQRLIFTVSLFVCLFILIQPLKESKNRSQSGRKNKKQLCRAIHCFTPPQISFPWDLMTALLWRNPANCITLSNGQL